MRRRNREARGKSEVAQETDITKPRPSEQVMEELDKFKTKQPAGLGIIHVTVQVQASAKPGARSLFIQNLNLDQTVASGVLEIQ